MNDIPIIHTNHSIKVEVKKDETYMWCACGRSNNQPFCDGSHTGTSFKPITYTATYDGTVGFCGCKLSQKGPICDGTHKTIAQ